MEQNVAAVVNVIAAQLPGAPSDDDGLQGLIFDAARMTPLPSGDAFKAIYRVLLDRESGPRAGSLLAFLERDFIIARFNELETKKKARQQLETQLAQENQFNRKVELNAALRELSLELETLNRH